MVSFCDDQTIKDLEFPIVLEQLYNYCVGPTAQSKSLSIQAISDHKQLQQALCKVNEWVKIKDENLSFPALQFEELALEIQLLPKKNASLPMESFIRIRDASDLVNRLVIFFQK
jgi:dsDNA-specific endonuclease/ATPase MutS2